MKPTIAIAISGGIDSMVAASLLKEQGHNIIGVHFITGYEAELEKSPSEIHQNISRIAGQIGVRIQIIDCNEVFKTKVVDYFAENYMQGKTPNPCIVCNESIKFGTCLNYALKLGAQKLATGHYAKITRDSENKVHLLQAIDPEKDQSYFLSRLTQNQLDKACFPLGGLTKSRVIKLASEKKLIPIKQKPSQDICFVQDQTYGRFLLNRCKIIPKPGIIQNTCGKVIGRHKGLHLFTIGQRRKINCPASEPYYVISKDIKQNRLIVGFKKHLLSSKCTVQNLNWIHKKPDRSIQVKTRLRYRSPAISSTLIPVDRHEVIVKFESPQQAVSPGQGAVFYKNNEVIGGGWIA